MANPFSPNPENAQKWEDAARKLRELIREIRELNDEIPSDVGLNVRIDSDGFSVSLNGFEEKDYNWYSSDC